MGFPGTCFHLSTSVRQHDAIRRSSVIEVGTTAKRTSNPTKTLRNRHTRLFRDREAEAAAPREHRVGRGRGRSRGTRPAQRLRLARQRSALSTGRQPTVATEVIFPHIYVQVRSKGQITLRSFNVCTAPDTMTRAGG